MSNQEQWAIVIGECFACGRVFGFHALKVPSFRPDADGERQPICATCVERINPMRRANGLGPITYEPDAYQPFPAEELNDGF